MSETFVEPTTQDKLIAWAGQHADMHENLALLDPYDLRIELSSRTTEAQRPETSYVAGRPISPKDIEAFVEAIDPRFSTMIDTLTTKELETRLLTKMGEKLESGSNVIVLANHENIGNLGFVLGAYICALRSKGYDFRAGTIIGKAAPYLGRKVDDRVMSLIDVLSFGCDDIYIGYPDTDSTTKAGISEEEADSHNKRMGYPLMRNLVAGGNFMVIDPTGKTNRIVDGVVTLGAVNKQTTKTLSRPNTLVTTAEIWLENGLDVFVANNRLYKVGSEKEDDISIDDLMQLHFDTLRTHVDPSIAVFEIPTETQERLAATAGKLLLSDQQN